MSSWQLVGNRDLKKIEHPTELNKEKSVKIRVSKSSISTSDTLIFNEKNPFLQCPVIFGTSGVGYASEDFEHNSELIEKATKVYIAPYSPCNQCYNCKNGRGEQCQEPIMLGLNTNGCFSNFSIVPKTNVYALPENVKEVDCLFIDNISFALNIINSLNAKKGDNIIIFGASVLGNVLAQLAQYYQLVPIVIDSNKDDLALCEENGIYYTVNSAETKSRLTNITCGQFSGHTVFITNSNNSFQDALHYTNKFGTIAFCGFDCFETNVNLQTAFNKQLKIKCLSHGYGYITQAINILAQNVVQTKNLVDRTITFDYCADVLFKISTSVIKLPQSKKIVVDILSNN